MKLILPRLKHFIAIATLVGVSNFSADAQTLKTLGSYQPTILDSESAALFIYRQLPTTSFKDNSGCFQRAHNWAYKLSRGYNINSMKAFLFFTKRYQREFAYPWMYHVAPLISVRKADGSIEDMVFDPTFVNAPLLTKNDELNNYDNKPISINEWTKYFIFPDVECPVVENYQDYFDYQERYYCYIMKTPMFTYLPENLETEMEVRTTWKLGDLDQMQKALK